MATKLEKPRDVIGGGIVLAIGAAFLLLGRDLDFGDSFQMGPGYFPTVLSVLMMILGAVMIFQGRRGARAEGALQHVPWPGLLSVIGSVVFFGLTIRGLGLGPAVALVVLATASASRYSRWGTSVLLALGMTAFSTLLFVFALGLPLPIFGPWLSLEHWSPAVTAPAQ
jgi:Tripartite tricarboxylate transporter TctB family